MTCTNTRNLIRPVTAILALLLALTAGGNAMAGGEDFPFRCQFNTEGTMRSFEVKADSQSPTGYTMYLFTRLNFYRSLPVRLDETEDGKYFMIWGRHRLPSLMVDRHILAYVSKEDASNNHIDIRNSWHNRSPDQWDLAPMRCR